MTVTFEPNAENMEANSIPITPPPIIHRSFGVVFISSISRDVRTPGKFAPSIGRTLVTAPVAIMMYGAVYSVSAKSFVSLSAKSIAIT